jgi:hypothetical protein
MRNALTSLKLKLMDEFQSDWLSCVLHGDLKLDNLYLSYFRNNNLIEEKTRSQQSICY